MSDPHSQSLNNNPPELDHELNPAQASPDTIIPSSSLQDKALMLVALLSLISMLYFGIAWALNSGGRQGEPSTHSDTHDGI